MFSKIKRIGTTSCKVQITVDIKWLTILESIDYRSGLFLEFERGSKSIATSSRDLPADPADSKLIVHFDESLALVMTLYKDSAGKYIEKKGKLVLKGLSKVTMTVVKLGSVNLSLNSLADDYERKNMILQLGDSKGRTMGTINVATTSKYLGDATADGDDSSVMSGASRGTFSSASHGDLLHGLGSSQNGTFRREKSTKFSEDDTKLSSSMRAEQLRYQIDEDSKCGGATSSVNKLYPTSGAVDKDRVSNHPAASAFRRESKILTQTGFEESVAALNTSRSISTEKYPDISSIELPPGSILDKKDLEIIALKQQLKEAKNFQAAMEDEFQTKVTSMIERIIEIEDESDLDHFNHEQQTIKLLKAAGIYEKSGYDLRDSENNLTYSDTWADLFRQQTDEERIKVMALKKCLIQFSDQLTQEENYDLLDAGIVLTAAKNKGYR